MHDAQICFSGAWNTPIGILSFFSLMMSMVSFWLRKTPWIWGTFLGISLLLAYQSSLISLFAFFPIAALLIMHVAIRSKISEKLRSVLVLSITALSLLMFFHLVPGFHNWLIAKHLCLGSNAVPYNFWMNYDKPFVGIFILAFHLPLFRSLIDYKKVAKVAVPLSILGVFLILLLSIKWNIVEFDFKITRYFWLWPFVNLILVVIPEEAFVRGFIQEEIFRLFKIKNALANICSVVLASVFFALLHVMWMPSLSFTFLVFLAGIIYGGIYQYTKSIEAAIFCHFLLNFIHFFFFTYPALQS